MCGRYASYWNAFLSFIFLHFMYLIFQYNLIANNCDSPNSVAALGGARTCPQSHFFHSYHAVLSTQLCQIIVWANPALDWHPLLRGNPESTEIGKPLRALIRNGVLPTPAPSPGQNVVSEFFSEMGVRLQTRAR